MFLTSSEMEASGSHSTFIVTAVVTCHIYHILEFACPSWKNPGEHFDKIVFAVRQAVEKASNKKLRWLVQTQREVLVLWERAVGFTGPLFPADVRVESLQGEAGGEGGSCTLITCSKLYSSIIIGIFRFFFFYLIFIFCFVCLKRIFPRWLQQLGLD